MLLVNQYKQNILDHFYLDAFGKLRYKKDGYLGRYRKDELVSVYPTANGYLGIHIPKTRRTAKQSHIVWILSGKTINDGEELDHIDGNRHNDSINNLRIVTRKINNRNRKKRTDNTSGITGIRWDKSKQTYIIRRTVNGIRKATSRKTLQEAIDVLNQFTLQDGDYTARHGK